MGSKEEILTKIYKRSITHWDNYERVKITPLTSFQLSEALEAMDEYSKLESIEFVEWCEKSEFAYIEDSKIWVSTEDGSNKTTSELYTLFQERDGR